MWFISPRNAFFSKVGLGISANTILLLFHICTFLLQHRLKPTNILIGLLNLIHRGMMAILGYIATDDFVSQDLGDDIKYKSIMYLHLFSRGFSICATCLLSFLQVIVLSPRSSCLTNFQHKFPHQPVFPCFLMVFRWPWVITYYYLLLYSPLCPQMVWYLLLNPAQLYELVISSDIYFLY